MVIVPPDTLASRIAPLSRMNAALPPIVPELPATVTPLPMWTGVATFVDKMSLPPLAPRTIEPLPDTVSATPPPNTIVPRLVLSVGSPTWSVTLLLSIRPLLTMTEPVVRSMVLLSVSLFSVFNALCVATRAALLPLAMLNVPLLSVPPARFQLPRASFKVRPPLSVPVRLTVLAASRLNVPVVRPACVKAPPRFTVEPVELIVPVFDHQGWPGMDSTCRL